MSIRTYIAIGGAAVVLGAAAIGAGIVQAQATPTPSATPTQQQQQRQNAQDRYLQALATRLNVTVDRLREAMQQARQEAGIPDRPAKPFDGQGGPRGFGLPGRGPLAFLGQQNQALATLFNITPEQLRTELQGKTVAEVAQAHGRSAQDAINTIVTTSNQQIDQMATQRNLSAERVAELKQQVAQRTPELVNNFRFGQPRTRGSSTSS
jgi:hypothetical protein